MSYFSKEKLKDKPGDWKSPAMYTHIRGYKFCIGVDANGSGYERGNSINLALINLTIDSSTNVVARMSNHIRMWAKPAEHQLVPMY